MDNEPIQKVRGFKLLRNHIKAMFLKLCYNTMRNKLASFIQIITPIINISISVWIARSWKFMSQLPPLELSLESGFRKTVTLVSEGTNLTDNSIERRAMMAYKDYFKSSSDPTMLLTDIGRLDLSKFYLKLVIFIYIQTLSFSPLSNFFFFQLQADLPRVRYENLVGATFAPQRITAWFSNYGYHDSAISLAMANNAIMGALSPGSSLKFINHPLPYSIENLVRTL